MEIANAFERKNYVFSMFHSLCCTLHILYPTALAYPHQHVNFHTPSIPITLAPSYHDQQVHLPKSYISISILSHHSPETGPQTLHFPLHTMLIIHFRRYVFLISGGICDGSLTSVPLVTDHKMVVGSTRNQSNSHALTTTICK